MATKVKGPKEVIALTAEEEGPAAAAAAIMVGEGRGGKAGANERTWRLSHFGSQSYGVQGVWRLGGEFGDGRRYEQKS